MSKINVEHVFSDDVVVKIFEQSKVLLKEAALTDVERAMIEKIELTDSAYGEPLGKMCAKMLTPFNTQRAGGFEVDRQITRSEIEDALRELCQQFDGIVLGVESSKASLLYGVGQCCHRDEVVVYNAAANISDRLLFQTETSAKQSMKLHAITISTCPKIWVGHTSSGTSELRKFPLNRQLFKDWISGVEVLGQTFDRTSDIFFGDVNFDLTNNINDLSSGLSTIEMLQQWSVAFDVQFVFPFVRVRKKRYANRPFANNQLHKSMEQIAESMVAVVPSNSKIESMDDDGLVVIHSGRIQIHKKGAVDVVDTSNEIEWPQFQKSFSESILLDHKPIVVRVDGQNYQFHNFMDFKTGKGIQGEAWYNQVVLDQKERQFVDSLLMLMH